MAVFKKRVSREKTPRAKSPKAGESPIRVRLTEAPLSHERGGALRVLAGPNILGAENLIFGCALLTPGEHIRNHRHIYGEEVLHITEGYGHVCVDGKRLGVGPGDTLLVRPGQQHSVVNDGEAVLRLLFASAPQAPTPEKGHCEEAEP